MACSKTSAADAIAPLTGGADATRPVRSPVSLKSADRYPFLIKWRGKPSCSQLLQVFEHPLSVEYSTALWQTAIFDLHAHVAMVIERQKSPRHPPEMCARRFWTAFHRSLVKNGAPDTRMDVCACAEKNDKWQIMEDIRNKLGIVFELKSYEENMGIVSQTCKCVEPV
jgi:hypothetical protein